MVNVALVAVGLIPILWGIYTHTKFLKLAWRTKIKNWAWTLYILISFFASAYILVIFFLLFAREVLGENILLNILSIILFFGGIFVLISVYVSYFTARDFLEIKSREQETKQREIEALAQELMKKNKELEDSKTKLERQQMALLNVLQDVSYQKTYEETQSQSLLKTISDGIVVTDELGAINFVNPGFVNLLGFNLEDIKGKVFQDVLQAFDLNDKAVPPEAISDKSILQKKESQIPVKLQLKTKDAKKRAVILSSAQIVIGDKFKGIIRVIHDYTEDLELQKQKDDFFSVASHELRTPLTVISGNLDNILQGYGGSKLTQSDLALLKDMMSASDRLIGMVNEFLNVSRIDQGRVQMDIKPMDVCELMQKIVAEMTPVYAAKKLSLKAVCNPKDGLVMADSDKVREVIINLLGNSLKFTKAGGVSLEQKIGNGFMVIFVSDTGMGIAKEKQGLLFRRFQQAMDRTLAREAGGTGLGLYISREFTKLMGGDMWLVKSEPGKGSVFAFSLPLAKIATK